MYIIKSSLLSFVIFLNIILLSHGVPRGPSTTAGITDDLKPIGKLAYSFENVPQLPTAEHRSMAIQSATAADKEGNANFLSILNRFFEKNDILSSLLRFVSKASEEATQNANNQQKEELYGERFLKENERIKSTVGKITTEKQYSQISAAKTSDTNKAIQLDEPIDNFSIDSIPTNLKQPDAKLPPLNNEWKSTLFGPKGMLTEVFRFVNEKRKQGFEKATPQSDLPPSAIGESKFDFPKIFDALMKSGDNGFDDQKLPEIPFIGICDRNSCGDIFKAVDQFKKSELFSNFQTAISLIQDPKGWDVIEELLQNPELIEQYVGKSGNIQGLLGKSNALKKSPSNSLSVLPSDGDLGVDFTNEIDEDGKNALNNKKPIKVETSIDSGSDYYTAVDKTKPSIDYDYEGAETVNVEEEIINSKVTTSTSTVQKKKEEPPLPELSFSVDETPEISTSIDTNPDYGSGMVVDEVLTSSKNEIGLKKQLNALERRFVFPSTVLPQLTTLPLSTTTTFSTPIKHVTSQKPHKNFRRSDDYYSMYYDNN